MFAQPKPILPGVEDEELSKATDESSSPTKSTGENVNTAEGAVSPLKSPNMAATQSRGGGATINNPNALPMQMPPIPKIETAWERGLRQAKEMKRRSQQRKVREKFRWFEGFMTKQSARYGPPTPTLPYEGIRT